MFKMEKTGKLILIILLSANLQFLRAVDFPDGHKNQQNCRDYEETQQVLEKLSSSPFINVSVAGKSVEGRNLYLVRLNRNPSISTWKFFLFAQQHGNEPAGKEALLTLMEYIHANPSLLQEDVDLWIMPLLNPDGAEKDQRRNANNADLNRDHIILQQPETQILHRVFREIMPHVAVDCHEFGRDSKEYTEKGWLEWPRIMMDCLNNPMFDEEVRKAGLRWINEIGPYMAEQNINYCRYFVGDVPPNLEQRFSTPELDDARNGLGTYGGLTFIIESGLMRNAENPNADIGTRIDAYLHIFMQLLHNSGQRETDLQLINHARSRTNYDYIPVNYFWGSAGLKRTDFKVIDLQTMTEKIIPTANFMTDMIVKRSASMPHAYFIEKKHAKTFIELLNNHGLTFELIESPQTIQAEPIRILRVETEFDAVYARYAGRQISEIESPVTKTFPEGGLKVKLNDHNSMRAALLLEPSVIYGLYQYDPYRSFLTEDGYPPVWRVVQNQ